MKRYYLGLNAGGPGVLECLFTHGTQYDEEALKHFLVGKYGGEAMLCKNGRSGLALALKAYFQPGDEIIINGFTCYAVYEAVKEAGMKPLYADITKEDLNFNVKTLKKVCTPETKGVIIQNTLGNPVNINKIEKFAREHNLIIIEDLAHCVGVRYPDGREVGTVGAATVLSFGKDKAINTISGGAVIFRKPQETLREARKNVPENLTKNIAAEPKEAPKASDVLRARFYPLFCLMVRGLDHVHLGGALMRGLIKIHFVEKSADNRLSLTEKIPKYQAKLALRQLVVLSRKKGETVRDFYLVRNREMVLSDLRANGYMFDGVWYEKPIAPERYYKKVEFPEDKCPVATEIAKEIINFPKYYTKKQMKLAHEIIEPYILETEEAETKSKKSAGGKDG